MPLSTGSKFAGFTIVRLRAGRAAPSLWFSLGKRADHGP